MALVPDKALRIRTTAEGEVREEVAADQLRPGDIIEIAPAPASPPMPACSTPSAPLTRAP